ncbi:MAG TPA: DeoR family transcriptional regulator [Actinomycetota bacterium]|nr:DeoR family transcriptional regulator [Actinomycetota bacterium]
MTEIEGRKARVLRILVAEHIRTGEPVGSGALAARHKLGVSPATIRNDMASLEEEGYLSQPHTSAGRIPTDLGYRFYVDTLPRLPSLGERQERAIAEFFGEVPPDVDETLRMTASLLSRLTHYGAVAQPPGATHVFIGGVSNIASEETFERRDTAQRLLETLEEEAPVLRLLGTMSREGGVAVRIGRENPVASMREAAIVVGSYRARRNIPGAVAVIGPLRMHYPEAISAVQAVARGLSRTIGTLAG